MPAPFAFPVAASAPYQHAWGKRQTVLIGDAKGELTPNIHIQALRWGFMGAIEGLPRDQHLARTLKRFPATFSEADSSSPLSSLPVGPSESCFLGLANPGDGSPQFRRPPVTSLHA